MKNKDNVKKCEVCTCVIEEYLTEGYSSLDKKYIKLNKLHTPYSKLSNNPKRCIDCESYPQKSSNKVSVFTQKRVS